MERPTQLLVRDGGVARITHREPTFRFQRTFQLGVREDTLVFRDHLTAPWGAANDAVRYRLLDGGRTLEARESVRGARVSYDDRWVFEKRN